MSGGRQWSLQAIVKRMSEAPGAQFHIYASDPIPPSRQREIVSYRCGSRRGTVRRSTMSESFGRQVDLASLYQQIGADCGAYRNLFFTFTSSPAFGMASVSENRDFSTNYQSLFPSPITNILP